MDPGGILENIFEAVFHMVEGLLAAIARAIWSLVCAIGILIWKLIRYLVGGVGSKPHNEFAKALALCNLTEEVPCRVTGHKLTPFGETYRVLVDGGKTAAPLKDKHESLASAFGSLKVEIEQSKKSSREAYVHVLRRDPLATPMECPWAATRDPDKFPSIRNGIPVGVDRYGEEEILKLLYNNLLIGGEPGGGKALALATPVPIPDGWTTMGELKAGDLVFDENGSVCTVTDAWAVRYDRSCYRVHFSDGTSIVADAEHQWLTWTRAARLASWRQSRPKPRTSPHSRDQRSLMAQPSVVTTADIASTCRIQADRRVNHSIPVAGELDLPEVELPIHPYVLGLWLGDGRNISGSITVNAESVSDIETNLLGSGMDFHRVPSGDGVNGAVVLRLDGLTQLLKDQNLLNNKHIPSCYLRASQGQRRGLLAGLLDTDGHCDPDGGVEFYSTVETLAAEALELVRSLGYRPTIRRDRA